ncbi:Hypothetical protein R9X50_00677700 [Acrodontium crateriforme]|uniref:Neprosin PEP catalytic domain-containing protein n=1 Tax=Acrodontium crateriforme TaxID=150365 RepID=A0AAQ3M9I5_9PEZI|nr:Hypothetical protein R9X50_00677700 [Acrodontium crateriforme]
MHWVITKAVVLAAALRVVSALPTNVPVESKLNIVKTTTLPNGQVIDWVTPESQIRGTLATPPPPPESHMKRSLMAEAPAIPAIPAHLAGPAGTVPIPRNKVSLPPKRLPEVSDNNTANDIHARSNAGTHWYASSSQTVNNFGGGATFSLFKAYVQSTHDFSLLQTAVIRDNAPNAQYGNGLQTVESGWINYPDQIGQPHLFTYFTTCNYQCNGANQGGWNRDVAGWVQQDSTVYPGYQFSPYSVDGGKQYDLHIEYKLSGGNWWLWVIDRYIGYYPASLFSQGGVNAASTLGTSSSRINFYGEIYNSEAAVTTTDMGSGEFPETGFGKSGYMHNIIYYDTSSNAQDYDGSAQIIQSDTSRYRIAASFKSTTSYKSYAYLGGPGAGGVVGG